MRVRSGSRAGIPIDYKPDIALQGVFFVLEMSEERWIEHYRLFPKKLRGQQAA
jgi:hypothetical protein